MTVTLDLENMASDAATRRTLSNLSLSVAKCKKIVVVTGAGISCSCGIPDFRSSDGLYALVKQQYPDVVLKGRDLFDASLFRDPTSTAVFYTFISQLKQSIDKASPSPTHKFIKTLDTKKKLLRSYTQNIDGLEERAGLLGTSSEEAKTLSKGKGKVKAKLRVKEVKNVQLHGDIHRVRCTFCSAEFACTEEHAVLFNEGNPPPCPECTSRSEARVARSARPLKIGTLRPAIVLYDEPHPLGDDIGTIQTSDLSRKPDMLIIMGTSLKVHGFKKLVKDFARIVHSSASSSSPSTAALSSLSPSSLAKTAKQAAGKVIFVNKTEPGSEWDGIIDFHVKGATDEWCEKVVEDWKKMRPADWEVQKTLEEGMGGIKVVKDVTNTIAVKGKGGPFKPPSKVANRENEQPSSSSKDAFALPAPPLSPGKRRKTENHYSSDGECSSPSKKRASREFPDVDFTERGLLFADSTNTKAMLCDNDDGDVDIFDMEKNKLSYKPLSSLTLPNVNHNTEKPKPRTRMEVVITSSIKSQTRTRKTSTAVAAGSKRVGSKVVVASSVRSVKARRTRVTAS